jgi:FixJ family two-component response regulator
MSQPWVLIVDDDKYVCEVLEATISSWNIRTKSVINPIFVADEIKKKFYNIILLDIFMPEMNGIDLLLELHKSCQDTKIIIITGYADKEIAIKALSMGAFDFLEKPIAMNLLYHVIKRALDIQKTEIEHRKTLEEFGKRSQELVETIQALSVLMKNIEIAKQEMGKTIVAQFRSFLVPIIDNIQNERSFKKHESQLELLSNYIENLTGDLSRNQQTDTYLASLSFRELQIALMIKNCMTNEDIATRLHISPETVRTHRRNIRKKLGMKGAKARLHARLLTLEGNALEADVSGKMAASNRHKRAMDSAAPPD